MGGSQTLERHDPPGDPRLPAIRAAARAHRERGLAAVTGEHYEGGHWLGSFATYLATGRGLATTGRGFSATGR